VSVDMAELRAGSAIGGWPGSQQWRTGQGASRRFHFASGILGWCSARRACSPGSPGPEATIDRIDSGWGDAGARWRPQGVTSAAWRSDPARAPEQLRPAAGHVGVIGIRGRAPSQTRTARASACSTRTFVWISVHGKEVGGAREA